MTRHADNSARREDQGPRSIFPAFSGPPSHASNVGHPSFHSDIHGDGPFPRSDQLSRQREETHPGSTFSTATFGTRLRPTAASSRTYNPFYDVTNTASFGREDPVGYSIPSNTGHTMPFRDPSHRPLIDLIPNHDLDVSDEEDAFYARDDPDDYLLHPKWRAMINRTTDRIPRRIKRYSVIYLIFALVLLISWRVYLGPQYSVYKEELRDMDAEPEMAFGKNLRPEFKGMTQVASLEERYLPKGEGRLIVVGDVHGCREELEHLLKKVDFDKKKDHLILTGDVIAKGPDSPGVVSLASRLGASCVRGNHEDKVLLSVAETSSKPNPALPGPNEAVDRTSDFLDEESFSHGDYKVRKLASSFSQDQIAWLQQCPVILRVGHIGDLGDVVVVHAGLVPDIPLEQQDPFHVMNMRTIDLKTRLPSENRDGTPWEKFWNHVQKKKSKHERMTVIYGHDRKRGMNIQKWSFGLDSGCVSGGRLTAMVIEASGKHSFVDVKCKGYVD